MADPDYETTTDGEVTKGEDVSSSCDYEERKDTDEEASKTSTGVTGDEEKGEDEGKVEASIQPKNFNIGIAFNIGGLYHETTLATLLRWPNTRLGRLALEHSPEHTWPYFFDRNPRMFASILHYYRHGNMTYYMLVTRYVNTYYMLITRYVNTYYILITRYVNTYYMLILRYVNTYYMLLPRYVNTYNMLVTRYVNTYYMLVTRYIKTFYMLVTRYVNTYCMLVTRYINT